MVRTQIYLTEEQRNELIAMSRRQGKRQSELIREAIDRFIENSSGQRRQDALCAAAGMWKDHDDIPDFGAVRAGWDRA